MLSATTREGTGSYIGPDETARSMLIPTPPRRETTPTQTDYAELLTAMRLLSGKDSERDASRAREILERLSNSDRNDIARDAQSIIRAAEVRDWFEDKMPHYFELERIATESLKNKEADPRRRASVGVAIALVALLIAGLIAHQLTSGSFGHDQQWILMWLVGLVVVAGLIALTTRLDRLH